MSDIQKERIEALLRCTDLIAEEVTLHHGDCVGADADMHGLVMANRPHARFHVHPPNVDKYRAWCRFDEQEESKQYLVRNHDIVDASDLIIATPAEMYEVKRGSGTWATIRYARSKQKSLIVVWPDGSMSCLIQEVR